MEPETGMRNWGKTQDDQNNQSVQGGFETEGQSQILPILDKVPQEGFYLKMTPEDTAKESRRNELLTQHLIEAMQPELFERTQAEVK